MKKLLAVLLCAVMVLSLSACSLFMAEVKNKPANEVTNSKASVSSSTNKDIANYVASMQSTYDTIAQSFKEILVFKASAKGNSLCYTYTYKTDNLGDLDLLKTTLDGQYDTMKPSMLSDLALLQVKVPGAESIIVEYRTKDGELITSLEFK